MIRSLPSEGVNYLVGENTIETRPLEPYSELALAFLDALSEALTRLPEIADYPDIRTFAFWCRKGNIQSLRKAFLSQDTRLGLGLVLHITPSNVPIHFVFSYAFGLLAGNANVVRVPSKPFPQVKILANAVNQVFEKKEHAEIKKMTAWVTYPPDAKINLEMSSHCRARMIWGGDETIRELRQVALPPQSVELVFADRYSLCLLDAPSILALDGGELKNLAMRFFNDGFLMDQNACSSPHLVVWLGDEKVSARDVFWKAV